MSSPLCGDKMKGGKGKGKTTAKAPKQPKGKSLKPIKGPSACSGPYK